MHINFGLYLCGRKNNNNVDNKIYSDIDQFMLKVILIALETYKKTLYILLLYCSSSLLCFLQLTLKYYSSFTLPLKDIMMG